VPETAFVRVQLQLRIGPKAGKNVLWVIKTPVASEINSFDLRVQAISIE
jgi:hypothetical protein